MPTFAELGIPFPLFEAPIDDTLDYAGLSACHLCGVAERHCFSNCTDLLWPCPSCGVQVRHHLKNFANNRIDRTCHACNSSSPFPASLRAVQPLYCCYECLRTGRATIGKDSEFGAFCRDEALRGLTCGVPELQTDQFEQAPFDPEAPEWLGVCIPSEYLWELVRTPGYASWQGDTWLFCCRQPMIYMGSWPHFVRTLPPGEAAPFFNGLFELGDEPLELGNEVFRVCDPGLYISRCKSCGRHRGHWDCS